MKSQTQKLPHIMAWTIRSMSILRTMSWLEKIGRMARVHYSHGSKIYLVPSQSLTEHPKPWDVFDNTIQQREYSTLLLNYMGENVRPYARSGMPFLIVLLLLTLLRLELRSIPRIWHKYSDTILGFRETNSPSLVLLLAKCL